MVSRGPDHTSADRVRIPQTGLTPGEVASCHLRDKLQFSYDWAHALGWKRPPEVTLDTLFEILTYAATKHGYRVGPDQELREPTDWQNNGAKKIGCKCGSEAPCAEFERLRTLFAALGFGEGHNPLGNGLALAKAQVDAANSAKVQAEERYKRLQAEISREVAARTSHLGHVIQMKSADVDILLEETGRLRRMLAHLGRQYAEAEVKRDLLSGLLRRMARRSIEQNRRIKALDKENPS